MKVGTRLAILRIVRDWTQDELARKAGIRSGTVSDYERGKMVPGFLALQRLVDAMGYRLSDLETVDACLGKLGQVPPAPDSDDLAAQIQEAAAGLGTSASLESQGLLVAYRTPTGRVFLSPSDLELLRQRHKERPVASTFKVEGNIDQHKHVLKDLETLAKTLETMAKLARKRIKALTRGPACSTAWISTLPIAGVSLRKPIPVTVVSDGKAFSAFSGDVGSTASGRNRVQAVQELRKRLAFEYVYLDQVATSKEETERLEDLRRFIRDDEPEEEP